MRLKQFMANTLPRTRKSKNKSAAPTPPSSTNHSQPSNEPLQSPTRDKHAPLRSSPKSPQVSRVRECSGDLANVIAYNKSLVTEDFQYLPGCAGRRNTPYGVSDTETVYPTRGCVSTGNTPTLARIHGVSLSRNGNGASGKGVIVNVNLNVNSSDRSFHCGCHKQGSPCSTPESWDTCNSEFRYFSCLENVSENGSSGIGDGNFNTVPRTRTRIRTNPWLPSPRASPSLSPHTSPVTSPTSSMMTSLSRGPHNKQVYDAPIEIDEMPSPRCDKVNSSTGCGDMPYTDSTGITHNEHKRQRYNSVDSADSTDSESTETMQRSFASDTTDNSITANLRQPQSPEGVTIEGGEVLIDLKNGEIKVRPSKAESPVSFEYEEVFESRLETTDLGDVVGSHGNHLNSFESRDLARSPDPFYDNLVYDTDASLAADGHVNDFMHPVESCAVALDVNSNQMQLRGLAENECAPDSSDSEGTLCQEAQSNGHNCAVDLDVFSGDTEGASALNDGDLSFPEMDVFDRACDAGDDAGTEEDSYVSTPVMSPDYSDSAYESGTYSSIATCTSSTCYAASMPDTHVSMSNVSEPMLCSGFATSGSAPPGERIAYASDPSGIRSVRDIHSSLQEKVMSLRREKLIVDEKVRQAQEEDRLRRHEMMRFKKQLTHFRKQVLLQTLRELKDELEGQSQRLQCAYDKVLDRQWDNARLKRLRNTTV